MAKEPQGERHRGTASGGRRRPGQALNVLAQYIKDFSFENPNAPRSLGTQQSPADHPDGQRQRQAARAGTDYEVELSIEGGAGEGATPCSSSSCSMARCSASSASRRTASMPW